MTPMNRGTKTIPIDVVSQHALRCALDLLVTRIRLALKLDRALVPCGQALLFLGDVLEEVFDLLAFR